MCHVLKTQHHNNRKEHKMQVEIIVHDIIKGEEPLEDGYYLVFTRYTDAQIGLEPMYWHADKRAWTSAKDVDNFLLPASYWGRFWAYNFLNKEMHKEIEEI